MITDKQLVCSDQQSIAAAVGTVVSTNEYDLGSAVNNLGRGKVLRAIVTVDSTVTSGGAATLTPQLIQSANPDLSSPDVLHTSIAAPFALASLGAGAKLMDTVIPDSTKRYLGFQFVIGGATITGGNVTAQFVEADNSTNLLPAAVNF